MEYTSSHLYFHSTYRVNTSDKCDIPFLFYERTLYNYFIPYHRKYSGQHSQSGKREAH